MPQPLEIRGKLEAVGDLYTSSLIALGLILFVITFIVLAIARYMLLRIQRRAGA